jgi:tRNA G18 (ribose-2'-O)-methylase SpoU
VFGVPAKISQLAPDIACAPCYTGSAELMAEVVGFHLNRGVLATADRVPVPSVAELIARSSHLAVLEGINDHENLGGLFRNAAAFGVDAILLGPGCADPLYRRSVRVSMGHVLRVPFAPLRRWTQDLHALRAAGFRVVALTPLVDAVPLPEAGVGAGRVAWLLGAEGAGLSAEALAAADLAVRIPMASGVDSLNVATAAAIAFASARRVEPDLA